MSALIVRSCMSDEGTIQSVMLSALRVARPNSLDCRLKDEIMLRVSALLPERSIFAYLCRHGCLEIYSSALSDQKSPVMYPSNMPWHLLCPIVMRKSCT